MTKYMNIKYGIAYCRYSTDMQREESIDAQLRAIRDYAERNGITIVAEYIDRAQSATSAQRPEFQRMIKDSDNGGFSVVIVHKLDRFSRDRYDSMFYKRALKRNGVSLLSVTENLDDSPESIVLESVLEGMAEYYSKNLAREVEKGKRESALKCQHVGGTPPLGYNVGAGKRYVINEREAEAVRLIFRWVRDGKSYDDTIAELNRRGYKSKRGGSFGKNTLYSILKNEKYYGLYTYNRSSPKDVDGKRNGHKHKPREEWITIENGVPPIISKTEFDAVQKIMTGRMQTRKHSHAKETYLLTGKMVCSVCGGSYVGARRRRGDKSLYVAYGCNRRYRVGATGCGNRELSRAYIENWVIERLSSYVLSNKYVAKIASEYNQYIRSKNKTFDAQYGVQLARAEALDADIGRTVSLLLQTSSNALTGKLQELEAERAEVARFLVELEQGYQQKEFSQEEVRVALARVRELLKEGTLETTKALVHKFVDRVEVKPDVIVVHFNFFPEFTIKLDTEKDCLVAERLTHVQKQSFSLASDFGGGERLKSEPPRHPQGRRQAALLCFLTSPGRTLAYRPSHCSK